MNTSTNIQAKDITINYGVESLGKVLKRIVDIVNENYQAIAGFAQQFDTGDLYTTARKVWEYLRYQIRYQHDEPGFEQIRTPQRTLADERGDCEDLAILAASIFKALGYEPYFMVVSFDGVNWQHIFVKVSDIVVDPVHDTFNQVPPGVVKSFIVGLDGILPMDLNLQGTYVQVLEGVDPLSDLAGLISGWDQDMNPQFWDEEARDLAEQYIDSLQGATLGDIGKIRLNIFRKKQQTKKQNKKVTSKKVGAWLKQKGLAPARAAYLTFLKTNIFNQAAKLYLGYMDDSQARQIGIDPQTHQKLKQVVQKLEDYWRRVGGDVNALRKAIMTGRGAKKVKKDFGLQGLGAITGKARMFWKYVDDLMKKQGLDKKHIERLAKKAKDKDLEKARKAFLDYLRKNRQGIASVLWLAYLPADKVKPVIGNNYGKIKTVVQKLESYWKAKGGNINDLRNAIKQGGRNRLGLGVAPAAAAGEAVTAGTAVVTASAPFWKKVLDWLKTVNWKDVVNTAKQYIPKQNSPQMPQQDAPAGGAAAPAGYDVPQMPATQKSSDNFTLYLIMFFVGVYLLSKNNSDTSKSK